METKELIESHEDRLARLGMGAAAGKLKEAKLLKRKLALAYEHFKYVRQEKVDAFQKKLYERTVKNGGRRTSNGTFQELAFTPLKDYPEVPPAPVLEALEAAQSINCFDEFEVAHIKNVRDPILFGRIKKCPDRFFVSQWDDDVKLEDLIGPGEG